MANPNPPTGFFSLPLELREQIYKDVLHYARRHRSSSLMVHLTPAFDPIRSLREADPRIAFDLAREEEKNGSWLCFSATDKEWIAPNPKLFKKLSLVWIDFESFLYNNEAEREASLKTMFHNLKRFVEWFKEGGNKTDELMIRFGGDDDDDDDEQNDKNKKNNAPSCWTQPCLAGFGYPIGTTLATREASPGRKVTVIESRLAPLKSFPTVKDYVGIFDLKDVTDWCTLAKSGIREDFEYTYMEVVFTAWQEWLEPGGRKKGEGSWTKKFERRKEKRDRELRRCLARREQCFECMSRLEDWGSDDEWDERQGLWIKGRPRGCSTCGHYGGNY